MLVLSSLDKGGVIYQWDFPVLSGLNGSVALASLLPRTSFSGASTVQVCSTFALVRTIM